MLVNREDGTCRECDGTLEIVDVDDATMTVFCTECDTGTYKVEPDAFGDGCMNYFVPFSVQKAEEWDAAEELQGGA